MVADQYLKMRSITVYDPPPCCTTGVCGPDVDPLLPRFAGMLFQLKKHVVEVERYNLAQEPLAFAKNAEVRAELENRLCFCRPGPLQEDERVCCGDRERCLTIVEQAEPLQGTMDGDKGHA